MRFSFVLAVALVVPLGLSAQESSVAGYKDVVARATGPNRVETLTLEQCLERSLRNNHKRKISRFEVELAEAQHRQALSGYWPQITAKAGVQRSDQPVNLFFPGMGVGIPAQQIPVPGGAALVTIPANAFGPGFPPSNVQLPVAYPGQTINTPAAILPTPAQNLKLVDRDLASGSLDVTWLLFDGGWRKGLREQSSAGVEAMVAEAKRTDLAVSDTVRRMYWGAVMAHQLEELGQDVLSRFEVTLHLTESYTKEGAGKINKTDYLYNKVVVGSVRSAMAELEKNEILAQSALAITIGMPWDASVRPASEKMPDILPARDLDQLVSDVYQFNPDWAELEAGLRAAEAADRTVRSDYLPKLALKGNLHKFWNGGFNSGLSTDQNRTGWTVGVGVEVPIFNGMLTQNKAHEALLRIKKLKETQLLLKDGLGLQVKSLLVELRTAQKMLAASMDAAESADQNRDLNMRAYESDMAEPDKVIQSQIIAALASSQRLKAQYDSIALGSQLNSLIGHEVGSKLADSLLAEAH